MRRAALYPLVAVFSAVWSSAFVAGKIGTAAMDPLVLLTWRFGLTTVALFPAALARGGLFQATAVGAGAALGLLYNVAYLGLTFAALRFVSATVVILIVGLSPFGTALMAAVAGQERLSAPRLCGMGLGFGGVALIALGQGADRITGIGVGLCACGMLAFCAGTVFYRARATGIDAVRLTFWQSAAGFAALLPAECITGQAWPVWTPRTVVVVAYLALVVGIGGMGLWFFLIRASGPAVASTYHLLNPVFALIYAHLVFGAPVAWRDAAGAGLVCLGLFLVRPGAERAAKRDESF
ncbi:MAG: DMT family transporter [Thermodesulfobacteriota bacterium]